MKRYFSLSTLFFLLVTICFISCSEEEVDNLLYTGKDATMYMDGQNIPIYHVNAGQYPTFFEFTLYAKKDDMTGNQFYCSWNTTDLSNVKVGDDVTQYNGFHFSYVIGGGGKTYEYAPYRSNKKGSMKVTKIDTNKKELSLEAKDMYLYQNAIIGTTDDGTVSGTINLKYKIDSE